MVWREVPQRGARLPEIQVPGDGVETSRPPAMALRGDYVGFVQAVSDVEDLGVSVKVADLRRYGSGEHGEATGFSADPRSVLNVKEVGSVAVSSRGSLAWISCPERNSVDAQISATCRKPGLKDIVYRYDTGTKRLSRLASGRDIDPASLRRVGATVSWRQAGRRLSAAMT